MAYRADCERAGETICRQHWVIVMQRGLLCSEGGEHWVQVLLVRLMEKGSSGWDKVLMEISGTPRRAELSDADRKAGQLRFTVDALRVVRDGLCNDRSDVNGAAYAWMLWRASAVTGLRYQELSRARAVEGRLENESGDVLLEPLWDKAEGVCKGLENLRSRLIGHRGEPALLAAAERAWERASAILPDERRLLLASARHISLAVWRAEMDDMILAVLLKEDESDVANWGKGTAGRLGARRAQGAATASQSGRGPGGQGGMNDVRPRAHPDQVAAIRESVPAGVAETTIRRFERLPQTRFIPPDLLGWWLTHPNHESQKRMLKTLACLGKLWAFSIYPQVARLLGKTPPYFLPSVEDMDARAFMVEPPEVFSEIARKRINAGIQMESYILARDGEAEVDDEYIQMVRTTYPSYGVQGRSGHRVEGQARAMVHRGREVGHRQDQAAGQGVGALRVPGSLLSAAVTGGFGSAGSRMAASERANDAVPQAPGRMGAG